MKSNKSKINLANKICSILFFAFAIISFVLSVLIVINVNGRNEIYKAILNIPFTISIVLSVSLNVYLIYGMIKENKDNYRNPFLYLLMFTLLFTVIIYIYCMIMLNEKPVNSNDFTAEFWLILVSSGINVLFSCWNWLIIWGFLRPLYFSKKDNESKNFNNDSIDDESI